VKEQQIEHLTLVKERMMASITTPFGRHSTATEVVEGIDLSGKRAIVTGAASGIGVETARALARTGAEVTLAVRNTDAGARTAADITATTGNPNIHVAPLDLSDRTSIASFIATWDGPLHILVNNAGVMASPEQHTPEGWEMQFATNHLGHFALALGLHDALAADGAARIVSDRPQPEKFGKVQKQHGCIIYSTRPASTWNRQIRKQRSS
jgi:NAD(P)-dependent dehydrogenase (short-subunit alcohol dehydrogenase family)